MYSLPPESTYSNREMIVFDDRSAGLLAASSLLIVFILFRINHLLQVPGRWAVIRPLAGCLLAVINGVRPFPLDRGKGHLPEGKNLPRGGKKHILDR